MKKLFIILSMVSTTVSIPTYSASSNAMQTAWTALATVAGAITSGWVLKHYWEKHELAQCHDQTKKAFNNGINGNNIGNAIFAGAALKITDDSINSRFRERYKYTCIALGAAGAAVAAWGLKSLLTNK